MAFVRLSHQFENFSCMAMEAALVLSILPCVSHCLHGYIPVCTGKLLRFTEGSCLIFRTQTALESSMYAFSRTSQGHDLAPASKDVEAEVIDII